MALSADTQAIVAALEILRDRVTQLPLAIAQNAAMAAEDANVRAGRGPGAAPREPSGGRGGMAGQAVSALVGAFARLLGPLAALGTFLSASTSGAATFSKAISLLATAVAPVLLPVMFLLATALAAASEVIFKEMLPALEDFYKFMMQTGLPAIVEFTDTLVKACRAIAEFDKALGVSDVVGGMGASGSKSQMVMDSIFPTWMLRSETVRDTMFPVMSVAKSDTATSAAFPLWGMARDLFGGGSGDNKKDDEKKKKTAEVTDRAKKDALREMILSMGPKASSGSVSSVWSKAQMAHLNQSPFERRMLEMTSEMVKLLSRAAEPGYDPFGPLRPFMPSGRP